MTYSNARRHGTNSPPHLLNQRRTMTSTEKVWRRNFQSAHDAIPAEWVWTDESDGWQGIDPAHAGDRLVQHYQSLMNVGYARGWL